MANREACELYIEQEIKSALEEGKKPWTIGKELSAWVEKLFEVTINPATITKRAQRIEEHDDRTNVLNKSQPIETIKYSKPEIIENRQPQGGGAREGAGRKPKENEVKITFNESIGAISDGDVVSKSFIECYRAMEREVINCKKLGWKQTDRKTAIKYLNRLLSIAEA